jgi:hypothetical protein
MGDKRTGGQGDKGTRGQGDKGKIIEISNKKQMVVGAEQLPSYLLKQDK